ncbi:hypothetical protein REJC140_02425 [Pseudorhizobium endolithicum]|uniref:Uncharacterized protein n=1 Tax=Pseudorhizobium endolithicum TaxID=1191678 RepID=A0ABN7JEE8_9HYPH|nr:hypothetical protein [Pseudorhizobium endolithicum]CAD7026843.1 hypothetical protein REJC140_02425 [Pseudorhizobium endolithicum]
MFKLARRLIIITLLGTNFALLFGMLASQSGPRMPGSERLQPRSCSTYPLFCGASL